MTTVYDPARGSRVYRHPSLVGHLTGVRSDPLTGEKVWILAITPKVPRR